MYESLAGLSSAGLSSAGPSRVRDIFRSALGDVAGQVDRLLELDVSDLDDREVMTCIEELERESRRLPAVMQRLVRTADERRLGRRAGHRNTAGLLRRRLHITAADARGRVALATDLAEVRDSEGQAREPELPVTSHALSRGDLSAAHARVIQDAVRALPPEIRISRAAQLEAALVAEARQLDPHRLARRAEDIIATLDVDALRRTSVEQQRRRTASFVTKPDGSAELTARLTPVGAAIVQAALYPLAAPQPADAGGRDERNPGQRLHDALVEACQRLMTAKEIPGEGGVPATIIATIPLADLTAKLEAAGVATTQYGAPLSIHDLLRAAGEALIIPIVVDDNEAPLYLGRAKRFASKEQTYALIARDRGCSFPGCDHPPPWTQRHHIQAWIDQGLTDIDNLTLLCSYHHANFAALGWECVLIQGVVHWIPPADVDPHRHPLRNDAHDRRCAGERLAA